MVVLCDADYNKITQSFQNYYTINEVKFVNLFGRGDAAEKIIEILTEK